MAINLVDKDKLDAALTATADAIRAKTGGTAELNFDMESQTGFESAVEDIPEATEIVPLTVNENGEYTAPAGQAYNPVTVALAEYDGSVVDG